MGKSKGKSRRIIYEFGPFRLDVAEYRLMREGKTVRLTAKAFSILTLLVQNAGHLVGKDEIMQYVWPDNHVEENNLTVHISAIRKSLGLSPSGHEYIETLPRRGYLFVEDIRAIQAEDN